MIKRLAGIHTVDIVHLAYLGAEMVVHDDEENSAPKSSKTLGTVTKSNKQYKVWEEMSFLLRDVIIDKGSKGSKGTKMKKVGREVNIM